MNKKTKLLLALQQVEGVAKLTEGNRYIMQHLAPIHAELNRQLSKEKNGKETD